MNCNCLEEIENRLSEKLKTDKNLPTNMKPKMGELRWPTSVSGKVLNLTRGTIVLNIPFTASWLMPSGKIKETTINVTADFCPFCGKGVSDEQGT